MKIEIILMILIYFVILFYISIKSSKTNDSGSFVSNYFSGNKNMSGFVLAMTMLTTYLSISSFVSGPGIAYSKGLSWIFLAVIQIPSLFLTLGIIGKKIAIISRKLSIITIIDFLRKRYDSNIVVILSSFAMIIFFTTIIVAQFIGAATIFSEITKFSYEYCLFIFAFVIIIYTSIGGFNAVILTDVLQGIFMIIACIILFFSVLKAGGGYLQIMEYISDLDSALLEPTSGGTLTKQYILSFWILLGVGIVGLPQTIVRIMNFRSSKNLHNAMIIGTITMTFIVIFMHLIGFFGIAVLKGDLQNTDFVIPKLALDTLHPIFAGIFLAAILAAIMSTIDSLILICSSIIVKDIYIYYFNKNICNKKIKTIILIVTICIGIIATILSLDTPEIIVKINLFSLGGLQTGFLFSVIFGLYWKKANSLGAILSLISGISIFVSFNYYKVDFFGIHYIVPALTTSLIFFIIGSFIGKKPDQKCLDMFF